MHVVVVFTFFKLCMVQGGVLFVHLFWKNGLILDNLEVFPNSPRLLSLFTISFLSFSQYIGKTIIDNSQYKFIKAVPFAVVPMHSLILLFKRKFLVTCDDLVCLVIFLTSFAIYVTYETSQAEEQGRSPLPFLHTLAEEELKKDKIEEESARNGFRLGEEEVKQVEETKEYNEFEYDFEEEEEEDESEDDEESNEDDSTATKERKLKSYQKKQQHKYELTMKRRKEIKEANRAF
mmetsp:Transcript_28628/g.27611  ORF Transcript_28628/g.27611 Transcript_28628/m.27611 type:complete len:234 (+) Transcript_28628:797-1498(+)